MRRTALLPFTLVTLLSGCATPSSPPPVARPSVPPPARMETHSAIEINVPPAQGLPSIPAAKGKLDLVVESNSIDANRSHHTAQINLLVTDLAEAKTFLKLNTTISGDVEGSPSEGLSKAFGEIMHTVELLSKSLPTSQP